MAKVTVQAIADELGLSKFAVSRALSGKSGVSDDTRRLVVDTAERMGYEARSARIAGDLPVRVLLCNAATANRELWIDVRNGIEMQAMREGIQLDFQLADQPARVEQLAKQSRAFILVGPNRSELFHAVHATGRPTVAVNHVVPPLLTIDQVTATDRESGVAVGEFLLAKGHRKLVYVHGQVGFPGRDARLRGFQESILGTADAEIREIAFAEDYAPTDFVPSLRRMVAEDFLPTAFFCGSDGVAVTVLAELHRLGLAIPEDCSVVGHADYPIATQVSPNLTTIHMPHKEMGMEAVRLLRMKLAATKPWFGTGSVRLSLVAHLVERDSTAAVGAPDWASALARQRTAAE